MSMRTRLKMSMTRWVVFALPLGAALALASARAHAVEQLSYRVVAEHVGFEVRDYPAHWVAEVLVPGPAEEAGTQAFGVLAGYIFGNNEGERRLAMTAPVTQASSPGAMEMEMAMAAPVQQTSGAESVAVQFIMPGGYTLASLPVPNDPRVKLREVPAGHFAAIRYSGTWAQANYDEHLARLRDAVQAAGLVTIGEPVYSRYNAPFVPWFMRRNEIWLRLE